jgi:hypothetical protein
MPVIVVASASTEAARAIARRLAAERASIGLVGGTRAQLRTLAPELVRLGAPEVLAIPCDTRVADDVTAAAHRIDRELGPIATWINTALTDHGYLCATRAALSCMHERGRGGIVQVAAPRGVRSFAHGLRRELELAGSGITVECVRTHPLRKLGAATLAGAAVVGLALLRRIGR